MNTWKKYLNADPTNWLLEEENPSVRYYTLLDIQDKQADDQSVKEARINIMNNGIVPRILEKQKTDGYWGISENFYLRGKYRGTSWQLIVLAELGADGKDNKIKRACQFILENSQDPVSGGFSYISSKEGGGDYEKVLPCLTANMAWSLIRLGYGEDKRVKRAIEWLLKYGRFDDEPGKAPDEWPYVGWKRCWEERTCHAIIVKSLKVFAEIPEDKRTPEMKNYIVKGAEHMLNHQIYKRSIAPVKKQFKWLEFGFPLMWNIDTLEVLGILSKLGYKDERMQDAMDLMISKQNEKGKWILENTFNGRFQVSIERKGKPSKWITLNALRSLKRFYG